MQLRLTLVDPGALRRAADSAPGDGAAATGLIDCLVEAPAGASLRELSPSLLQTVGRCEGLLADGSGPLPEDAVVGLPPLVDGAVITIDGARATRHSAMLELHVAAGPDSGAIYRIGPGEHTLGRSPRAAIRIDDPGVSRLHCVVRVGPAMVEVRDTDSTNGTYVDGVRVGPQGSGLAPDQLLTIGGTVLHVVVPSGERAACRADGEGHVAVNRPPRLFVAPAPVSFQAPTPPLGREPARFPLIAAALPAVAGLALVLFTGNKSFLFFVLLSPVMVLGTFLTDKVTGRRTARAQQRVYDDELAALDEAISRAVDEQSAARHHVHPGPAALLLTASAPRPRLWERRPGDADFLDVRLGLGDLAAEVSAGPQRSNATPGELPMMRGVPVTMALRKARVTGIAGPRHRVLAITRVCLAQLTAWHSPRHLGLAILLGDPAVADEWRWVRWLPHLRPADGEDAHLVVGLDERQLTSRVSELVHTLDTRRAQARLGSTEAAHARAVLVVLDGAHSLRRVPGIVRLLDEGPAVGFSFLCLERSSMGLPAECRSTAVVTGEVDTLVRLSGENSVPLDVAADGVSPAWAEVFARSLAPLRDATPEENRAQLPPDARLLDLLPSDGCDPVAIAAAWSAAPRDSTVILGAGAGGAAMRVDLAQDGPHLLIAGTTGSGKSELLQTLIVGLALGNRPDQLSFVLIDYKGGAAFKDCARLPHTVGTVTDLDGELTERALRSLGAELRRRERVLRAAGCKDLDDYWSLPLSSTLLPRLVLVVDEFATLAEELPDFLTGLVGIAQRGRSLGVHLVLATQRPGGAVSADIRANTALRIALRVTDPAESADVIDTPEAAFISRSTPGRGVLRLGAGATVHFQAARIGGRQGLQAPATSVRALPWREAGDPPQQRQSSESSGRTDLENVVTAIRDAAHNLAILPVPSPWLPPLPTLVTMDALPESSEWCVPFGLLDVPAEQRRGALVLDLQDGGHLLVAGTALSGRSTALRTIAGALAARFAVHDVHLYAVEGNAGALASLAELPHCGVAVGCDEPARADRLLWRLSAEVQHRHQALSRAGFASVAEQRAAVPAAERMPWLVLLVDGWEAVQAALDEVDHGRPLETLLRLLRDGPAAGLRAVVTGERGVLTSRLGSLISDRLLLRLADPGDYGLAGISAAQIPSSLPPGRGLLVHGTMPAQVALLAPDHRFQAQKASLGNIAAAAAERADHGRPDVRARPMRVAALPRTVSRTELEHAPEPAGCGAFWTPVGIGGDELTPYGVDLLSEGGAFVVAGPSGSGRSTALLTIAHFLRRVGVRVVLVAGRRSPLSRVPDLAGLVSHVAPHETTELSSLVQTRRGPLVIIVDDVEIVNETPTEQLLLSLLRAPAAADPATGIGLLLAGSSAAMAAQFRGLTVEARRGGCGLLLGPAGALEADLFGMRPAVFDECPPGRGLLVVGGRGTPVQVAGEEG